MAFRYTCNVFSEKGKWYVVSISDSEYVGDVETMILDRLSIEIEGQSGPRFQPILGASATIGIVIDSEDIETLLTDIAGAEEGRFTLLISDFSDFPPGVLKFAGYILTDLISFPDLPYTVKPSAEIKATDAIGILKTIDYNDNGDPYEGYDTFVGHIFNCLNKVSAIPALYSLEALLKVVCNWYPQGRTYDENDNPLLISRCNHVAFYTIDSKGNYNYKSCYDVIAAICTSFGARFLYSDGSFWFLQINTLGFPYTASEKVYSYDKDQDESIDLDVEFRISNYEADEATALKRLSGGQFKFFPPLRKVAAKYLHRSTINMLAGKVIDNNGGGPVTYETVDYYNGDGKLYLTGTRRWEITALNGDAPPFIFVWSLTIQVGSNYYVTNDAGGSPQWSGTPGFYKIITNESSVGVERVFQIPPILTLPLNASGDLTFNIAFNAYFAIDNTPASGVDVDWTFEDLYLELLSIGAFSGQADITEYSATNNTSGNSAMIDLETILGDGPGLTSPGHTMYLQDDNLTWDLSDGWRVADSGTYKNLTQLLVNEIIRGQLTPTLKYLGSYIAIDDYFEAWKVIDWYGRYLIFNGGTFDLASDIVSGEWFEIDTNTGYTEGTPIDRPNESSGGAGSPSGSSGSSGGSSTPPRFLILEFENVTDSITPANDLFGWDYTGTIVLWNGRQLKLTDYSFNEPDIDWNFTIKGTTNIVHLIFPIQ